MSQENEQPVEAIPVAAIPIDHPVDGPVVEAQPVEEGHARKPRNRSRKKVAEDAIEQAKEMAAAETNGHANLAEGEIHPDDQQRDSAWVKRHRHWLDEEAGVRMERDRQNNLHTIVFNDYPPAEAVKLLEERGWIRDDEVEGHAYSFKISKLRPRESMELAEQTVLDVSNIVRAEKGMEQKESFFLSRG